MAWVDRVSSEEASRRAGGRRRWNALRRDRAIVRRGEVARLLRAYGAARGSQAKIARELQVSFATISRDVQQLLAQMRLDQ